jgi:hypothetical protein
MEKKKQKEAGTKKEETERSRHKEKQAQGEAGTRRSRHKEKQAQGEAGTRKSRHKEKQADAKRTKEGTGPRNRTKEQDQRPTKAAQGEDMAWPTGRHCTHLHCGLALRSWSSNVKHYICTTSALHLHYICTTSALSTTNIKNNIKQL